jgi:hypothetical protein
MIAIKNKKEINDYKEDNEIDCIYLDITIDGTD